MAFRYAVRPSVAFHNIYKYKQPLKICTPILKRSAQTQTADRNEEVKSFHEIPGPRGLPLIGTLLDYSRDLGQGVRGYQQMHVLQQQRVQQYGKIYREKILNHETVTISDPDDVEFLFRNEGKYPKREPPFPMWMKYKEDRDRAHGVVNLQNEEWYKVRRVLNLKMLRPKVVEGYLQPLSEVASDLLCQVKETRDSDGVVPSLLEELFKWSLESVGTVLFETRFGSFSKAPSTEAAKFIEATHKLFKMILKILTIPGWVDKFYRLKSVQEFYDCMDVVYNFGDMCINKKMSEIQGKLESGDIQDEDAAEFLTFLISRDDINFKEITANLVELLMAAVETTSNTTLWTLYLLARNPDVQKQLYEEVSSVLKPGEQATPAILHKMPFLRACVKETLRMYPAAWENARYLKEDITVQGHRIPPNTMIRMPLYVMGRNPELFDDPQQYIPERWLRDETHRSGYHAFASLPFGFGTRMCIGRRVAELEMHLLLSQVALNFWLESLNEVQPVVTSLLVPDKPVNLRFVDR